MRTCAAEGCQKRARYRLYCDDHYRVNRRFGTPTPTDEQRRLRIEISNERRLRTRAENPEVIIAAICTALYCAVQHRMAQGTSAARLAKSISIWLDLRARVGLIALVADRWQDVVDMCPQFVQEDLRDMQFPVGSLQRMLLDGACAIIAAELWKREHGAQ